MRWVSSDLSLSSSNLCVLAITEGVLTDSVCIIVRHIYSAGKGEASRLAYRQLFQLKVGSSVIFYKQSTNSVQFASLYKCQVQFIPLLIGINTRYSMSYSTVPDESTATISAFPDNGDISLTNFTLASINGGTNNQLTIKKDAWGNNLNLAAAFALPAYSGSNEHGEFEFSDIRDTNGNNWANNSYGITSVPFALLAGTDPVMSIDSITATGAGTNIATVTVNLSHRVATYVSPLTPTNVGTILGFTDAGAATTADFSTASGTISPDGRTLTMTIPASVGTYNAGDNFAASGLVSDWDSSQTVTSANVDI